MTGRKILGRILVVIFGLLFFGLTFTTLFIAMLDAGHAIWLSILVAFSPFVGIAVIVGIGLWIVHLICD